MKKLLPLILIFIIVLVPGCQKSQKYIPQEDDTVYVSQTGKIHIFDDCSGMKYYEEMSFGDAKAEGYALCKNCFD